MIWEPEAQAREFLACASGFQAALSHEEFDVNDSRRSGRRSGTIAQIRYADGVQRHRAVRSLSADGVLHERSHSGVLSEAAADGGLRQHGVLSVGVGAANGRGL